MQHPFVEEPSSGPSVCPTGLPPGVTELARTHPDPLFDDGIVVTDARPFPTIQKQCRHGGWRRYGFPNQGRCVAFVRRGPRWPNP